MLLVSEVAALSRRPPREIDEGAGSALDLDMTFDSNDGSSQKPSQAGGDASGRQASVRGSMFYNSSANTNKQLIMQQLEQWEEPVRVKHDEVRNNHRFTFIFLKDLLTPRQLNAHIDRFFC